MELAFWRPCFTKTVSARPQIVEGKIIQVLAYPGYDNCQPRREIRLPLLRTFFRSGYDGEVDGPVGLGVGQTLDLGNVEVGVDFGARVFAVSVVRQDTSARLGMRYDRLSLIMCSFGKVALTVWIRIGATPVFWNLVLKPLRIALVPSRWSASACNPNCVGTSHQHNPRRTHGLENDIRFSSILLQVRKIIEGAKYGLESQFFKPLGLFGRAKVDSDLVVGPLGVLDEMGEDSAPNVT